MGVKPGLIKLIQKTLVIPVPDADSADRTLRRWPSASSTSRCSSSTRPSQAATAIGAEPHERREIGLHEPFTDRWHHGDKARG